MAVHRAHDEIKPLRDSPLNRAHEESALTGGILLPDFLLMGRFMLRSQAVETQTIVSCLGRSDTVER